MCTGSVCGLAPLYLRQPAETAYEPQILWFQMTYWMPRRRAIAYLLPYLSVAISHFTNLATRARPAADRPLTPQSNARPSLCSDWPPTLQARTMPRLRVAGNALSSRRLRSTTPGFAVGEQV